MHLPLSMISPVNSILSWGDNSDGKSNSNTDDNNNKLNKDRLLHTCITLTNNNVIAEQKQKTKPDEWSRKLGGFYHFTQHLSYKLLDSLSRFSSNFQTYLVQA